MYAIRSYYVLPHQVDEGIGDRTVIEDVGRAGLAVEDLTAPAEPEAPALAHRRHDRHRQTALAARAGTLDDGDAVGHDDQRNNFV